MIEKRRSKPPPKPAEDVTPEEEAVVKSERISHIGAEAIDTAAGAVAGATVGAIAGPVGVAAGAAIGAAIGALVGVSLEREDRKASKHDRELDAAGVAQEKLMAERLKREKEEKRQEEEAKAKAKQAAER